MSAIKMEQFGGMLPAWSDNLLPAGQAASASNGYLFSGALVGWRLPKLLRQLTNSAAKFAYRLPTITKGRAGAYLTINTNPVAGDVVTLGDEIYTFRTGPALSAYDVLIGATAADSATNLLAAFNVTASGLGTLFGSGTCPNPAISQTPSDNTLVTATIIHVIAPDDGAAYNDTDVAESTNHARMIWVSSITGPGLPITTKFAGGVNASFDAAITGAATWMEFTDADTTVVRSPVVDDKFSRYYFASPSLAPQYNTQDRITGGLPAFTLGLNPPGCAPIVEVNGGGDAATLGFTTDDIVTGNVTPGGNTLFLYPIFANGAMQINDVQMIPTSTNPAGNYAGLVYSDNGGVPGDLLAVGDIVTGSFAATPILSPFLNPVGLLRDTKYWIGFMTDDYSLTLQQATNNSTGFFGVNTFSNGPPGVFTSGGTLKDAEVFADLTTASVLEARAYVYTWISAYKEESAPSPATLVNGWSNGTWSITMYAPVPDDLGVDRNITIARLYRTVSSLTGQTVYYWVCDFDVVNNKVVDFPKNQGILPGTVVETNTTPGQVNDTLGDDVVALNIQLPSTTWFPPPAGLQGIYAMPNGMTVGFKGNEIWFSEPYFPHAWPPGYVLTTEFPIVGLGITGNAIVACTTGTPYVISGVNPASMSSLKLPNPEPCIARGSIMSDSAGVYYSSQKGLILVNGQTGQAINTTEGWITRDRWSQLTPQKNLRAVKQASSYFCYGTKVGNDNSVAQDGYTIELSSADSESFTIWPQPGGHRLGLMPLTAPNDLDIDNVFNDPWTGITMMIQNGQLLYYDFTDLAPTLMPYMWLSKKYQGKNKDNLSAMRLFFDIPPNTPAQNATRNEAATDDASWNTLQQGQYAIVKVFGDGNLVTTREVRSNGELLRIASDQKYEQWQFQINARVMLQNWQVASSVKELREI